MEEIIWSNHAKQDLQDIYEYIGSDSEFYALRIIDKILDRVEISIKMPKAGKIVSEFEDENIRELVEGNYRIIYYVSVNEIVIIRVHHGAQLLK